MDSAPPPDGHCDATCRICGRDGSHDRYDAREMMLGTRERFEYFRCAVCGTLQIREIPQDLARYYPSGYYSYAWTPESRESPLRRWVRSERDRFLLERRGWIGARAAERWPNAALGAVGHVEGLSKSWRILDVGCGGGVLVDQLHRLGYGGAEGFEPFLDEDVVWPSGARVRHGTLGQHAGDWDLVMMHHAFEHVPDPAATLRGIASLLRSGGRLLLRVPVVPSTAWSRYGRDWVGLDAPRHLHLFTVEGLQRLAAGFGFAPVRTDHDSSEQQFWASEQYRADLPLFDERSWVVHPERSSFSARQITAWRHEAKGLNRSRRGDQAALHFRLD